MDYGLCTISKKDWPVEDILELASDIGYDGVEVWGRDHVGNHNGIGSPDLDMCRSIADFANYVDLEVPVYGSYLRPGTDNFRDHLNIELNVAEMLGADFVRVWPGEQEYGDHDPEHWECVIKDLKLAGTRATERGVEITVEKHEGTLSNHGDGAQRLIEAVDLSAVGLNWQPLFFLRSEKIIAEAEQLASLSNNVHLQATPERGGQKRCQLEEAYFDIEMILDIFDRAGFDGYVEIEFVDPKIDYATAVHTDYEYLRSIDPTV